LAANKTTETVFIECGSMYRAEGPIDRWPAIFILGIKGYILFH